MRRITSAIVAIAVCASTAAGSAQAQERYIGEIFWGGWNFCPRGSAETNGQLQAIAQNPALFSLLGTTYGGDGRTTFALPDLRGRAMIGDGQGSLLTDRRLGSRGGAEEVTLTEAQIAAHDHDLNATTAVGKRANPDNNVLANGRTSRIYSGLDLPTNTKLRDDSIGDAGGSQPHENMMPYLTLKACIQTVGLFPSRS